MSPSAPVAASLLLVLAASVAAALAASDPGRRETGDAVVLQTVAAASGQRTKRQYGGWPPGYVPLGPCLTDKGYFGRCVSFRRCYPFFKLPAFGSWDTWLFNVYDTCTYQTANGRQKLGVCCAYPSPKPPADAPTEIEEAEPSPGQGGGVIPPNWPPPIPTHPPDHTIPPLPTHPPSPGYPTELETTTSTKKPTTTKKPYKPKPTKPTPPPNWPPPLPTHPPSPGYPTEETTHTTKKPATTTKKPYKPKPPKPTQEPTSPPNWPPPVPTHPPTSQRPWPPTAATRPTTTTKAPYEPPSVGLGDASCGAKNGYQDQERIVGGQNADPNEWPWIAAMFNSGRQFCGGSLIDEVHILTAAHCVAHMTSWDVAKLTVRLGDHNIKTSTEVKHVEKKVRRVVRHKNFDMRTLYNDIAILTLDSPVTFSQTIRSVCLPQGSQARFDGTTATVVGWGSLRESGPQPAVLQEVSIPVWTNTECKLKYGNAAPGGIVEHFLCAGRASKDSCSGDSGGPLMVNTGGKWTQVGIVSWGIGCGKGQYPGVYTRVTHFMGWITKNLK